MWVVGKYSPTILVGNRHRGKMEAWKSKVRDVLDERTAKQKYMDENGKRN